MTKDKVSVVIKRRNLFLNLTVTTSGHTHTFIPTLMSRHRYPGKIDITGFLGNYHFSLENNFHYQTGSLHGLNE